MDIALLVLSVPVAVLLWIALRRPGPVARQAAANAGSDIIRLLPRLAAMLIAAGFIATLLPGEVIASMIGAETGLAGILLATAVGGFVPGGPMIAFPIVVVLAEAGAGVPQVIAFLTAWAAFAFHRVLIYEIALMGWRFAVIRVASSLLLPPLAGIASAALLGLQILR